MIPAALIALLLVGAGGPAAAAADDGDCQGTRCYAAFSEPADFQTARAKCSELAGHLMTVRTADLHALLRRVLERSAGPYWVGLHRPAGCPDPASPLRGFRWETGDRSSDFNNWADGADSSSCARQCVSVSSEDGFKWSAGSCDGRSAGFLCESSRGDACAPSGVSGYYSRAPTRAGRSSVKLLPHGTVATRDPDGLTSICLAGEWVRAPWSCGIREGGCEFKCGGTEDRPVCLCPPGQVLSSGNPVACLQVQSDLCRDLGCEHACGTAAPPACTCRPGFELGADGRSCRDAGGGCGAGGPCLSPPRSLPLCGRGFRPNRDQDCVDLDECQQVPCEHSCLNTPGSFTCSCFDNYRVDPDDPQKCKLYCGQASCPAECDPNDPDDCLCPEGYILDVNVCVDINECDNFYCDHKGCKNSFGGFTCSCDAGFSLIEKTRCVQGTVAASTTVTYVSVPTPDTTRGPARLSAGGLVSVVVGVAVVVFLAVFLAYHFANQRSARRALSNGTADRGEDGELVHVEQKETSLTAP